MPRLLFITLSNIGDLVMTTPVLEALHAAYPHHLVDIVADPRSSTLLRACPYVGDIIHRHKRGGWREQWRFLRRLRRHRYEVAVDLRGPVLLTLARANQRGRKRRRSTSAEHAVEHHFSALRNIDGVGAVIPATRVWLDEEAEHYAAGVVDSLGLTAGRILGIAPGANWPGKIWPVARYKELIGVLKSEFAGVFIFGSDADHGIAADLSRGLEMPVVNLAGQTDLLQAAACLRRTDGFVGNDSGLGHIAAALAVPTLTVFGPGRPHRYRPWGEVAGVVRAPDQRLESLTAATVAEALLAQIAKRNAD